MGRLRRMLPHVLVGALALPFILRQNSWYEWANTLWLLELQTAHVAAHGIPTYFTDASWGYFYPQQLFYAGPTLALLSYPSVIFGAWPVFAAVAAGAFGLASAGISWTARNLGVPPRLALVPGILYAATPYTVSNLYGRGDWAELVAVGCLAVTLGAATSLLSGRARSKAGVLAILALGVAGIAGTHNLTLLFGALFAPVLGVALSPVLRAPAVTLVRRYLLVLTGVLTGVALCGAYVIPNIWLSSQTFTGHYSLRFLTQARGFDQPGVIFDPLPVQPPTVGGTYLHTQTLVVALVWCLAAGAVAASRRWLDRRTAGTLGLLCLAGIGVTLLIVNPSWWSTFPHALTTIQFPFRLVTYLALLTVIAIAVLLSVPAVRDHRTMLVLLLVATAWQLGLAAYLALAANPRGTRTAPTAGNVRANVAPPGFVRDQRRDFRLVSSHPVPAPRDRASVSPVGDDAPPVVRLSGSQPVGSLVATRVVASPLIRFSGDVSVAGATVDGFDVLRVQHSPWRATVRSACATCLGGLIGEAPFALLAGRWATLLGGLGLAGLAIAAARDRRRQVRGPGQRRRGLRRSPRACG